MAFCKFSLVYFTTTLARAKSGTGARMRVYDILKVCVGVPLPLVGIVPANSILLIEKKFWQGLRQA